MSDSKPLYVSKPSSKNLWREYRVHVDRLELETVPWGLVRVPFEDIEAVEVRPSGVIFDAIRGDYGLLELMRTAKLDLADLHEHVAVTKSGFWRQFRLTPDDPAAFKRVVDEALAAFRKARAR